MQMDRKRASRDVSNSAPLVLIQAACILESLTRINRGHKDARTGGSSYFKG
jgi:hypothetical protein